MVSKCNRIASLVILNYKIYLVEAPQTPLTRGGQPLSRPPPPSCRRHSVNTNGVQWPYHFLKADDGPVCECVCSCVGVYVFVCMYVCVCAGACSGVCVLCVLSEYMCVC